MRRKITASVCYGPILQPHNGSAFHVFVYYSVNDLSIKYTVQTWNIEVSKMT